jgi:NAD(P)-dependent dehydrogenase (short-subunit alcohol dehydrogenase family)
VLNVSTGLARFTLPGYAAYAAAKGGVEVLTRYMARELGERGIRVNVVAPGAVATDFRGRRRARRPRGQPPRGAGIPLGASGCPTTRRRRGARCSPTGWRGSTAPPRGVGRAARLRRQPARCNAGAGSAAGHSSVCGSSGSSRAGCARHGVDGGRVGEQVVVAHVDREHGQRRKPAIHCS